MPKWEILVLTMPSRENFLNQLLSILLPQISPYESDISIMLKKDDGSPVGWQRQKMREDSNGEYISFLDDDDLISSDYIKRIFPLLDGIDYIGFRVQLYTNMEPSYRENIHSLKYGNWIDAESGYYRDITHFNPMRRALSMATPMDSLRDVRGIQSQEDRRWARALRELHIVTSEHYIDDVMLHYIDRHPKSDSTDPFDPRRLNLIERLKQ